MYVLAVCTIPAQANPTDLRTQVPEFGSPTSPYATVKASIHTMSGLVIPFVTKFSTSVLTHDRLHMFLALLSIMLVVTIFGLMHHGRQGDMNEMHLQAMTNRIPPSWSPEKDRHYSFRQYQQYLLLWSASTDLAEERLGPTIAMRLSGSAKVIAREMDINTLQNGIDVLIPGAPQVQDPQTGQWFPAMEHLSGTVWLLRQLRRRYAPLDQEVQIQAISDLFHFKK